MIVAPDGDVKAHVAYDRHGVVSAEVTPTLSRHKGWHRVGERSSDRRPATYDLLGKPYQETRAGCL